MNIAQWLYTSAQKHPNAPALFTGDVLVADYREFASRSSSIAQSLQHQWGISKGDRVGIVMENRTEYLECLFAIWWLGAIAVPINAKLHAQEVHWILDNAEAALVVATDKMGVELEVALNTASGFTGFLSVDSPQYLNYQNQYAIEAPASRQADDLAWLFYTSGTTGKPKGVMLSHNNLIAMSLCYPIDVDPVSREDAALYAAPMSHGAGLYSLIHVRCGARHVVPASGGFDEQEILELARKLRNVSLFAAPTMVKRLVTTAQTHNEQGDGIKAIVYGGGPMYVADIQLAIQQMGNRFIQIYGQGESPMTITALSRECHTQNDHPQYLQRLASVGVAQSVVEVRITGSDGQVLPVGKVGEIEVKGATVMLGYWRQSEATEKAIINGWLKTGDMGSLDTDGFLALADRSKDLIISGGSNIYPREVEEVLLQHKDVCEVSVLGQPDGDWGEIVVAFVVCREGSALQETTLEAHCLEYIARFKRPKKYRFVDSLPKNSYGKVLKTELREWLNTLTSAG